MDSTAIDAAPVTEDAERWCDECGELGWSGVCPACLAFALREGHTG
jgi:hypothetical protein